MPVADKTVQCILCDHFRLKDARDMAKFGFGLCAPEKASYQFHSAVYPRQCAKFVMAEGEALAARHAWLEKRGEG